MEKSWELLWEGAPGQDTEDDQQNTSDFEPHDKENNDNEDYAQCSTDQFIIGDVYGIKPAVRIWYNDKHPSAWAGQPLTHEESRDFGYSAALSGGDNPWALFNSKKDWEVVRWGKLQGVGSMAFSDLLAINDVCFDVFSMLQHLHMSI